MSHSQRGKLIVVSGPSGAGKTTVLAEVLARKPGLKAAVSATTRSPRPGEVDGQDYFFLSAEEFARRREAGEFLESCQVFGGGHWYGTLWSQVTPSLEAGESVLLEIDVAGTLAVLERYPQAVTIFMRPSSLEELERRLRNRGTESEAAVARRMEAARRELVQAGRYQHQVLNDDVDLAVREICDLLASLGV